MQRRAAALLILLLIVACTGAAILVLCGDGSFGTDGLWRGNWGHATPRADLAGCRAFGVALWQATVRLAVARLLAPRGWAGNRCCIPSRSPIGSAGVSSMQAWQNASNGKPLTTPQPPPAQVGWTLNIRSSGTP